MVYIISWILEILIIVVPVACFTLLSRELHLYMSVDIVVWGLLQPLTDGLKLLVKESIFQVMQIIFSFLHQ